jgi:hypothetical protein
LARPTKIGVLKKYIALWFENITMKRITLVRYNPRVGTGSAYFNAVFNSWKIKKVAQFQQDLECQYIIKSRNKQPLVQKE